MSALTGVSKHAGRWLIALLVLPAVLPLSYAVDPNTPILNDGRIGPLVIPDVAEAAVKGTMPFAGTGILTADVLAGAMKVILTPEELRTYRPRGGGGPESVVGLDTRVKVYPNTYPYRATALVTFKQGSGNYICSAWFYGPDILATAGHCVHTGGPGGSWSTNVKVYPGYSTSGTPYAAQYLGSVTGWTNSSNPQFDYGIIDIGTNVGTSKGWFGFWWQSASLNNLPSVINGYPGDKGGSTQWVGVDYVRVTQTNQVFYRTDTYGGESGSPVWHDRPPGSASCSNGPCAYAIHAYGTNSAGNNGGTRINQSVFNNLISWKNSLP